VVCLDITPDPCGGVAVDLDDKVIAKAPEDLIKICRMPIERSGDNIFGNGRQLAFARELLVEGEPEWRNQLGEDWVQETLSNDHTSFRCADCPNSI
jgi:hypothetical protein